MPAGMQSRFSKQYSGNGREGQKLQKCNSAKSAEQPSSHLLKVRIYCATCSLAGRENGHHLGALTSAHATRTDG
jgi:hypothetical protein